MGETRRERLCIGAIVHALTVAHQHAVIAQQRKHLAGGRRKEIVDPAVLHDDPLGVGSGQTGDPAPLAQPLDEAECAENLCLLAAQIVGCVEAVAARKPGHYPNAAIAQRHAGVEDLLGSRGAGDVWGLGPADARPHHAAQHRGQRAVALFPPCRQRPEDTGEPAAALGCSRTAACVECGSVGIAQEQPQVGRAPVARDELRCTHQCDSRSTVLPLDPVRKSRSQPRSACITCSM